MGFLEPKTKADCDRAIVTQVSLIERTKADIAGCTDKYAKAQMRHTLANAKTELARLKLKRSSLK